MGRGERPGLHHEPPASITSDQEAAILAKLEAGQSCKVHELAKELGVTSKEVLAALEEHCGVVAKSSSKKLDGGQANTLRAVFSSGASAPAAEAPAAEASADEPAPKKKRKRSSRKKKDDKAPAEGGRGRAQRRAPKAPPAPPEDPAEVERAAREWVRTALPAMGVECRPKISYAGRRLEVDLCGPKADVLLGKPNAGTTGELIDALQLLLGKAVFGDRSRDRQVVVDVNGFRASRVERAFAAAGKRLARFMKDSGTQVAIPTMNNFDRYAFHKSAGRVKGVHAESQGYGAFRALIVAPARPPKQEQPPQGDEATADAEA